jgi:hypothetical protein
MRPISYSNSLYLLPGWLHGQPQGWEEFDHIKVGEQWPWATPNQIMTWADDTFENLAGAFESFMTNFYVGIS